MIKVSKRKNREAEFHNSISVFELQIGEGNTPWLMTLPIHVPDSLGGQVSFEIAKFLTIAEAHGKQTVKLEVQNTLRELAGYN